MKQSVVFRQDLNETAKQYNFITEEKRIIAAIMILVSDNRRTRFHKLSDFHDTLEAKGTKLFNA